MDSESIFTTTFETEEETFTSTTLSNENTTDVDECVLAQNDEDILSYIMFGYSILVIIGLGFIVRRKALWLNCCWGRPGAVQPINFIDETGRRWAYAACFVIISNNVLLLFNGQEFWQILEGKDKDWKDKFGWVKVFTKLLDALSVCLIYFPFLACIDHRRHIAANVLGIIHVVPWIIVYSEIFHACPGSLYVEQQKIETLIFRIAIFIAYFIIGFSYVLDFIVNIRKKKRKRRTSEIEIKGGLGGFKISHHFEYVANLLRKRDSDNFEEAKGVKEKIKNTAKRLKYEKVFGFRYSTRLICCIAICTTVLIWFVIFTAELIEQLFHDPNDFCDGIEELVKLFDPLTATTICNFFVVVRIVAHCANGLSAVLIFIMLVHTLITYKRRWHQLLRGDHSWHFYGNTISSPSSVLLSGLKFAGFQVAFLIWGWAILTLTIFIVLCFVAFAFAIPLKVGVRNWLIRKLINLWPTLLLGIVIIPLIQRLVCKFLFLQDKGAVLALNNRRIYNAASYYFLILNIIVGVFSCIKRILIPLVLGIAFLSRLDQPLIMKGFETKDPGYVAFVSMLLVDLYHNHPVVKAFVELLIQIREENPLSPDPEDLEAVILKEKNRRSKMLRNRWKKIVTLVNNPSLALKALEQRLIEERDARAKQIAPEVIALEEPYARETDSITKPDEEKWPSNDNGELKGSRLTLEDNVHKSSSLRELIV